MILTAVSPVNTGSVYRFFYSAPWQNPIINNDSLLRVLQERAGQWASFKPIRILGTIRIRFIPHIGGGSVQSWNRTIKTIIDDHLWGETTFTGAEREGGGLEPAKTLPEQIGKAGERITLILGLLIAAMILWKLL